jgi:hypothetical protein
MRPLIFALKSFIIIGIKSFSQKVEALKNVVFGSQNSE